MATQSAVITFSLPEDLDSDQLLILASATKDGAYSTVETVNYGYGETSYEFDDLDDTLWYKIQFRNSADNENGPISEAVYGGTFSAAAPFLAVSTTTDGANYATTQDLYDYSGLTAQDVSQSRVSNALRRARAVLDYRTAEMGLDRFEVFDTETARRKYNASLRILKEAEINMALGNLYTNMSDDLIIDNIREGEGAASGSISIGSTSVSGDTLAERSENILYLATLANRYFSQGELLLASLDTNSIKLVANDWIVRFPRFRYPFNGF